MLDKEILEQLFCRNYVRMIRLAKTLLGDDDEAKDVVQDIFLRLADSDFRPQKEAYLLTAVRNSCLNRIRQMQLRERVKRLLPTDVEPDMQPTDKPFEIFHEVAVFVDKHMQEPHRSIFHHRFDDDMTIREIAITLDMNPNTTYKYLIQSIEKIRSHFK